MKKRKRSKHENTLTLYWKRTQSYSQLSFCWPKHRSLTPHIVLCRPIRIHFSAIQNGVLQLVVHDFLRCVRRKGDTEEARLAQRRDRVRIVKGSRRREDFERHGPFAHTAGQSRSPSNKLQKPTAHLWSEPSHYIPKESDVRRVRRDAFVHCMRHEHIHIDIQPPHNPLLQFSPREDRESSERDDRSQACFDR